MSSSVHFRFKSAREFETLSFEGDFLKVADLKVAIVERKKLNFGEGFDLEISDASTGDVFSDENSLVQKNTSVIVRRIPGLKHGGILSHQEMAAKNERYAEKQAAKAQQQSAPSTDHNPLLPKTIEGSDEAERIASLVMQSNVQYDQFPPPVRGRYSNRANNRGRAGSFGAGRSAHGQASFPGASQSTSAYPDRAPRPSSNYVCHRCNRPGHWIDLCPTNGDPTYDRIKVRAPTGIPRSMLRQVDAPESGTGLQDSSGHFVTLQPNEEEFARQTVGLRLSQAAASGMDRDTDPSAGVKDSDNSLGRDKSGTTPDSEQQQDARDDVKRNADPAGTNDRQEVLGKSTHDKTDTMTDGSKEEANGSVMRDNTGTDFSHESGSDHHSREKAAKPCEDGGLTLHGKKSSAPARVRQPQQPQRVGVPQLPMPAIPPGFPPIGMPPIPPGMPPIPPHILMAMAMSNPQNGRPPQLPPGMHRNIPMPFSTPPSSTLDKKNQDVVTEAHHASSENQQLTSGAASPEDAVGKRMTRDRKPVPKSQKSRLHRDKSEAEDNEAEGFDQQGVDRPSELIDSAFNAKPESHPSTLYLDREETRDLKQHSFHENDDGLRSESGPYHRKHPAYRSRSPSSSRVRSSPDEVRASPRQRERRNRTAEARSSQSPRRTAFEDRHTRSGGREERNLRYRSPGYREGARPDEKLGDGASGFYSRRRSLSPTSRERRGMNGTASPENYAGRSRSPEKRTRYGSPVHRRNSSRGWGGRENPVRRSVRDGQTERRFRSKTPPRRSRYDTRARDDFHIRQQPPVDNRQSLSVDEGRDLAAKRRRDENRRRYDRVERTRPAISGSERDELGPRSGPEDGRHYPGETRKGSQGGFEGAQNNRDERIQQEASAGRRRKREFERRWDPEQGDLKRTRRENIEQRKSVYYQEMKGRPSVHDRLGRTIEKRRRKRPRRSVHDRLG